MSKHEDKPKANDETRGHELRDDELDQVAGGQMVAQMATSPLRRDASQASLTDRSSATPINVPIRS